MGSGKGSGAGWLFLGCVAVAVVAGGYLGASRRPEVLTAAVPVTSVTEAGALLDVHVAGAVVSPGVVQVPEGSIVADAIAAAGGLNPSAVPDAINLASPVHGGDQVVVPEIGGGESPSNASSDGRIAINRADANQLQQLPGVGPVLAGRIVSYRDEHGSFKEPEDLLEVPGIGESKLASIRDLIQVP